MRDFVEARLLGNGAPVRAQQSRAHIDVSRDSIFVHDFAQDHDPIRTLQRVHGKNADLRRIHVLHAPVILRVAIDHIPAQVIHWDHLRRHFRNGCCGPAHSPGLALVFDLQITHIIKWAYSG